MERMHSKVAAEVILVLLCLLPLTLFDSLSQAADDQTSKAVRRNSSAIIGDVGKKVALVIGNKDYKDAPLRNPVNDAEDLSSVLKQLGFVVITKKDVNKRDFEEAIDQFAREMRDAQVAFFYFSGHGCEAKGENYLVPVNDTFKDAADLHYKAVKAGFILEKMEDAVEENKNSDRLNIIILDACRNNPFKGVRSPSRGLTEMRAPAGSFIAYATAPGTVAADGDERNGVYTKHLLRAIESNGISEQAFKITSRKVYEETKGEQRPWVSYDIVPDFFSNSFEKPKPADAQELARLREAERSAALEREQLEKAKREHEQGIARLREAEKVAALEKEKLERQRLEREVQEREQELAKLREAQRLAALEKERLEREKQEMQRKIGSQKQQEEQRVASQPASILTKSSTSEELGVAKLRRLADQGDARAQYDLGTIYYSGLGVPRDWQHAKKWLTKAANQGNVAAQTMLGVMYSEANDYTLALEWYRKAASQGDAMAQNNLGTMYLHGQGVSKDEAEAQKWFRKAGTRK